MGKFSAKEIEKMNTLKKSEIISTLQQIKIQCRNQSTILGLNNLVTKLQSQSGTQAIEVIEIDSKIVDLLKSISSNVTAQSYIKADNDISKIDALIAKRAGYCTLGGEKSAKEQKLLAKQEKERAKIEKKLAKEKKKRGYVEEEVSRTDKLQSELDDENANYHELVDKKIKLQERLDMNRGDFSLQSQIQNVDSFIQISLEKINRIRHEMNLDLDTTTLEQINAMVESLVQSRTVSQDQREVVVENIKSFNEQQKMEEEEMESHKGLFSSQSSFKTGASIENMSSFNRTGANTTFANAYDVNENNSYGQFDPSIIGTAEMKSEILKTKSVLNQGIDKYNDLIDDVSDDLKDLNDELRPLLIQRQNASPSECLTLDGKIDQINAKRNVAQTAIRRYRQALSSLQEKLLLIEKLDFEQGIQQTNKQVEQITQGRFQDFEGLAMYLKESIEKGNDDLDRIGIAGAVSDSVDVNMNTYSGANAAFFDADSNNKDEHKYDNLMKDIGIPMA